MKIPVRRACYEADTEEFTKALQTHLPYLPHARLFEWLYRKNPHGEALVWIATDPSNNRMIGVAAAFPRSMYCHGEEIRGYVLGDFCVDPGHRSLGLALVLQRACLEELSSGDAFVFDFPSRGMLSIYKRLRIDVSGTMIRYAKPLRADRKVTERVAVPMVASGISAVANAALKLRDKSLKRSDEWTIATEAGPWGQEFTQAALQWSPRMGVCVARTADYLNWRYGEHPLRQYGMLVARQDGALCGYLVHHMHGEDCTIDDLFAADNAVCSALLREAIVSAREHRAHTLTSSWIPTHPGKELLEKCGFRPRESSPVVLLGFRQGSQAANQAANQSANGGWFITDGDRES